MMLVPVLTPHGSLALEPADEAQALEPKQVSRLEQAFARGAGHGLLCLGVDEAGTALPPVLSYWRELASRYATALCALPGIGEGSSKPPVPIPADGELEKMAAAAPPMTGAEYLTAAVLADLWRAMDAAFDAELAQAKLSVQEFLKSRHPAWNLVGRVHFNLAENRKDEEAPFAFLATYTTRLSAQAQAQHRIVGEFGESPHWHQRAESENRRHACMSPHGHCLADSPLALCALSYIGRDAGARSGAADQQIRSNRPSRWLAADSGGAR